MDERVTLRSHLDRAVQDAPNAPAVAAVIEAVAAASIRLAVLIADGPLAGITGRHSGVNPDGDLQKDIDVAADAMMRRALRMAPVAAILSEESELPEMLDAKAPLCVCLAGSNGAGGADFNMRWIGSLVAESLRILVRGGVFLYPADARPGYREGRLRLLYEAHPMALVMEWAGGAASTGRRRILELAAKTPHQRVPLIMGSVRGVRDVAVIHEGIEPMFDHSDAPLFARRGLFL